MTQSEKAPRTFRAPGRVNLIGEHTDYNDGLVMPAAIELAAYVEVRPRADRRLAVHSENYSETVEFDLDDAEARARGHWSDYVRGVAVTLERAGFGVTGANLRIRSDVPMGAGLSSSAAIEVASALALLRAPVDSVTLLGNSRKAEGGAIGSWAGLERAAPFALLGNSPAQRSLTRGADPALCGLAKLCQRSENEFVGVRCGIMDPFIACHARAGQALMLDCRTLEYRFAPLPAGVKLVIANTMVRHSLAAGEYNRRRAECEEGATYFGRSLRDVTTADLERAAGKLPQAIYRRCRHVITENARVTAASAALEREDLQAFGKLMDQSHRSLRDDYEVSCVELDTMVEIAASAKGVYGSRMTGGGFGGCTISLVQQEHVDALRETLVRRYREAVGLDAAVYVSGAAEGAGEL